MGIGRRDGTETKGGYGERTRDLPHEREGQAPIDS
jgi:hypothetical protein